MAQNVKNRNYDLSRHCPTTLNVGELIPFPPKEVLPRDEWSGSVSFLCRLQSSFKVPVFADLYLDTATFFVPLRILFDDFSKVFVDPTYLGYSSPNTYAIPSIPNNSSTVQIGKTVANYLGIPYTAVVGNLGGCSILPFRAFALIYDHFFRDQLVLDPMSVHTGSFDSTYEMPNTASWSNLNYTGQVPHPARFPDLVSRLSVDPSRGPTVPVIPADAAMIFAANGASYGESANYYASDPRFASLVGLSESTTENPALLAASLVPDLSTNPLYDMNDFALGQAVQRYLNRTAKYGTDYSNYLFGAYGVSAPDAVLDRPQLLATSHTRLNIQQVAQTANNSGNADDIGKLGGFSQSGQSKTCRYHFRAVEHGYLMRVACIRYVHTYPDGYDPLWRRTSRFDFYDPVFAFIPPQPIMGRIVNKNSASALGFCDAWDDYRKVLNRATGSMSDPNGLGGYWSLGDFGNQNILDLAQETKIRFDSIISDPSVDQFVLDWFEHDSASRPIPGGVL